MKTVVRRLAVPDPEVAIFRHGFWAGVFTVLVFFGLVCSLCSVQITFP